MRLDKRYSVSAEEVKLKEMIDLTDSFPEGVEIFKKDNFRGKPVPENYRCRVKGMLVVPCSSMYLSE